MKYLAAALAIVLMFPSCASDDRSNSPVSKTPEVNEIGKGGPAAGTIVAADSVAVPDPLNKGYFSVAIIATEHSFRGTYSIKAVYGANDAQTEITFPKSSKKLTPLLRKGDEPFSYIVGFRLEDDQTFYDYFLVKAKKGQTEMKYLKAYKLP